MVKASNVFEVLISGVGCSRLDPCGVRRLLMAMIKAGQWRISLACFLWPIQRSQFFFFLSQNHHCFFQWWWQIISWLSLQSLCLCLRHHSYYECIVTITNASVVSGWMADLGQGSVIGKPMKFLHHCLLGSFAPCVLYGSNVERLASGPGTFENHCLSYTGLCLLGNCLFGWNFLAPWFSYPSRTAIRRKFNLEGSCEALVRSCGCCGSMIEDDAQREQCETACDCATHFCCHRISLCQEAREMRRRLPHPGFNNCSVLVMIPPAEQSMDRGV